MGTRRGWWYVLSVVSMPFLFLTRMGMFGRQAQAEADTAISDWATAAAAILTVLVAIAAGIALAMLLRTVR